MQTITFRLLLILTSIFFATILLYPQGKVYLVLGSDTAIWDGMDVSKYHCYYNLDLFTSSTNNTATVMSESFRNQITDSYGNKLKMTWWMIGGNMFRYALNNNVPVGNTMALYLMKKYYGNKIQMWGDELSLHYHTFFWSDFDGDGKYWWNQAKTFIDTKKDFDLTLAQFLIEENVFPISFRSGWHYMDNNWQNYLNELLPYSLHNDWPAKHQDLEEPTDNDYDWSQAPSEFVPFHPSPNNYQVPGESKGWNVRSKYMGSISQQLMDQIFAAADQGKDQVVCLWSHLPETGFNDEIIQVNNIAHQSAVNYPNVKFQYCTAIEAYQLWLKSADTTKPAITITPELEGSNVFYWIESNEPIFQKQPFVVVKDKYDRFTIAQCELQSENMWRTSSSFQVSDLAKVGVALSDTVGNLTTKFINYLPDDRFFDNKDQEYFEVNGIWNSSSTCAWGTDSRVTILNQGDSASVQWKFKTEYSGYYNLFTQFPKIIDQVDSVTIRISESGNSIEKILFIDPDNFNSWIYLATIDVQKGTEITVEMSAANSQSVQKYFAADVLKLSAYVRDKFLVPEKIVLNMNELSIDDSINYDLRISNLGIEDLTITDVYSLNGDLKLNNQLPIIIGGMNETRLNLVFTPDYLGFIEDTLLIFSDDPINPVKKIAFSVNVVNYYKVTDNDFTDEYSETGNWSKSVTQAYGNSSRYAYIQSSPNGPTAKFTTTLTHNGLYDIFEILPVTVNSANNALYVLQNGGNILDSIYLNQNEGSGDWKKIGRYYLNMQYPVIIKVIDSGESSAGPVIRADAFKISLVEEITDVNEFAEVTPTEFNLFQNYPNPFNPTTTIQYSISSMQFVKLKIYDMLGREVATLVNEEKPAGIYNAQFSISDARLSSGIYFYKLQAGNFVDTKKMMLLK